MELARTPHFVPPALALLSVLLLSGCLSNRYRSAPKDTPPAIPMRLEGVSSDFSVRLNSVVIFRGPGSWKKEAYWDEYIVTLTNRSDQPLTVRAAALLDSAEIEQVAGDHPWEIERRSREKLKMYEHTGRKVLLGAGLGAAWFSVAAMTAGTAVAGGSATAVAAGGAVVIGLPVLGIGTFIRTVSAKGDIQAEFDKRRLPLPLTLAPHESKSGSLFFAVTPGPRRLLLYLPDAELVKAFALPLDSLGGLHLPPATPAPAPKAKEL